MHLFAILTAVSAVLAIPLPHASNKKPNSNNPGITWDLMPIPPANPNYDPQNPPRGPPNKNADLEGLPEGQSGDMRFRWPDDEANDQPSAWMSDPAGAFFGALQTGADKIGGGADYVTGGLLTGIGAAWNSAVPPNPDVGSDPGFSGGN